MLSQFTEHRRHAKHSSKPKPTINSKSHPLIPTQPRKHTKHCKLEYISVRIREKLAGNPWEQQGFRIWQSPTMKMKNLLKKYVWLRQNGNRSSSFMSTCKIETEKKTNDFDFLVPYSCSHFKQEKQMRMHTPVASWWSEMLFLLIFLLFRSNYSMSTQVLKVWRQTWTNVTLTSY